MIHSEVACSLRPSQSRQRAHCVPPAFQKCAPKLTDLRVKIPDQIFENGNAGGTQIFVLGTLGVHKSAFQERRGYTVCFFGVQYGQGSKTVCKKTTPRNVKILSVSSKNTR